MHQSERPQIAIRDFHIHICRTDFRQMAEQAEKLGIPFGVCEHVYQFAEVRAFCGDRFFLEGRVYGLPEYWKQMEAYKKAHPLFRIGTELDYLPDISSDIWRVLAGYDWDYIVGAVHEINGWDIHAARELSPEQHGEIWHTYFSLQKRLLQSFPVQILAHPVRMAATVPVPENAMEELNSLARAAADHETARELNAREWRISAALARMLVKSCCACRCPIVLGSDAHTPSDIGRDFQRLKQLLDEEGAMPLLRAEVPRRGTARQEGSCDGRI